MTVVYKKEDHEGLPEKVPQHAMSLLLVVSDKREALVAKRNGVSVSLALCVGYVMNLW